LTLREKDIGELFFRAAMRRNLSRTVRRLDRLVEHGEQSEILERAL
jgi:hypothetical protein